MDQSFPSSLSSPPPRRETQGPWEHGEQAPQAPGALRQVDLTKPGGSQLPLLLGTRDLFGRFSLGLWQTF